MGKVKDETGHVYERLTVLERAGSKNNKAAWLCQCECGNKIIVTGDDLRQGHTKSCGCFKKDNFKKYVFEHKHINLEGQTFGKLTVLKLLGKTSDNKHYKYQCQCECGNIVEVNADNLTKENGTRSCGCLQKIRTKEYFSNQKNLINQKFGKLTVIERTEERDANGLIIYKCKCDCGTILEVSSRSLLHDGKTSCGCINSKGEEKISQILRENNIPFEMQKTFDNCINPETNYKLKFDFWVDNKYLIEYDGSLHFLTRNSGWNNEENLKSTQYRDNLKNQYCLDNDIPLIRIPYTKYETLYLEDLLLDTTKFLIKKEEKENASSNR